MIPVDRLVSVTMASSGSPADLVRVEPVTLAEARKQLNEPPTGDNPLIEGYIAAARAYFEEHGSRQTIDAIYEYTCCPIGRGRVIELPRAPMTAVIGLTGRDTSGVETELDPDLFRVVLSGVETGSPASIALDAYSPPGRIELLTGTTWPIGELRVRRRCGYGESPEQVPSLIKSALYFLIGHFYRNRAEVTAESVTQLPMGAEMLIRSFKYAGLPVLR